MALSAAEQYLIELINQDRLDPATAAREQGIGLNSGITGDLDRDDGSLQSTPMQVLAPNAQLESAALAQSSFLLADGSYFGHTGAGGSTIDDRIVDVNYQSPLTYRENLSVLWGGLNDTESVVERHHDALYASPSHRAAIFDENQSDIGIGQQYGVFRGDNASMLTEVFGAQGSGHYVTGVAYTDADRDDFYSIGEGLSDIQFSANGTQISSADAGGYALETDTNTTGVSIVRGGVTLSTLSIDTSDGNAKLDIIADKGGDFSLAVSTNTTLTSGIGDARVLGAGDLNLTGHSGANTLEGNAAKNKLVGAGGNDILKGYDGNDKLFGGSGADKLVGGGGGDTLKGGSGGDILKGGSGADKLIGGYGGDALKGGYGNDTLKGGAGGDVLKGGLGHDVLKGAAGNDTLWGGGGADKFVFNGGIDTVRDFKDDVDTIAVTRAMIDGPGSTVNDLLAMGEIVDGNAVFDLAGSHQLTVHGVTDLDDLRNDLAII